jgi:hypothetical protein
VPLHHKQVRQIQGAYIHLGQIRIMGRVLNIEFSDLHYDRKVFSLTGVKANIHFRKNLDTENWNHASSCSDEQRF